jgi:hypothetical protein
MTGFHFVEVASDRSRRCIGPQLVVSLGSLDLTQCYNLQL